MKNLKFSFALIIAILAVGLTVATKANLTGKAAPVTVCFTDVTLQDISGGTTSTPQSLVTSCASVKTLFTGGVVYLSSLNSQTDRSDCEDETDRFCCIEFSLVPNPTDPIYANVPDIDPDGPGPLPNTKYFIGVQGDIKCKIQ